MATLVIVALALRTPKPPPGTITAPAANSASSSEPSSSSGASDSTSSPSSPSSSDGQSAVKITVYGDSVTRAGSANFTADGLSDRSWVKYLGSPITLGGGYAVPGTTTASVLGHLDSADSALVIVALGANDLSRGTSPDGAVANLRTLYAQSSVKGNSTRIVVLALPPENDARAAAALTFNTSYEAAVKAQGWTFIDPWSELRASDGTWSKQSYTTDGVNPTAEAAKIAGAAVRAGLA